MILFIDTSDFNGLRLAIVEPKKSSAVTETVHQVAYNENYKTAEFLQKFLGQSKITPPDLTKVIVCSGPGSFTGIRVGIALAQALGFALNIPVIAVKKNHIPNDLAKLRSLRGTKTLTLHYGRKPNITQSKKR